LAYRSGIFPHCARTCANVFRLSFAILVNNKLRTFLASLAFAVGTMAVVFMTGVGASATRDIMARVNAMSADVIVISAATVQKIGGKTQIVGLSTTLTPEDAELLKNRVGGITNSSGQVEYQAQVATARLSLPSTIVGVEPRYFAIMRIHPAAGRLFNDAEDASMARVAIIGHGVAKRLFPNLLPIGQTMKIKGAPFVVIGLLPIRGLGLNGEDEDNVVIVPLRTAMIRLLNITYLHNVYLQVHDIDEMRFCVAQCTRLLRDSHNLRKTQKNDFAINDQSLLLGAARETSEDYQRFALWAALLAFSSGGVSILVVMIMVVQERTPEIGLRRAIGATAADISFQFVLESIGLAGMGSIFGYIVGLSASLLVEFVVKWPVVLPPWASLLSVLVSLVVGGLFGAGPAIRAALLNPAVALTRKV
jgi:putative ABC transport system permease protein